MPTETTTNPLWELQAQYLPGSFQAATDIYNQGAPAYYPGSTVAGFDPVRAQGQNLGIDAALGAQTDLANQYTGTIGGILGGTDAYTQNLAQQAAGATNFGFGQAGTLGSARNAQASQQAAANTIADRQLQAGQQVQSAQQAAALPGQTLSQIGRTQQDYQQQLLDADKQRYDYTANLPSQWLNQYQSSLAPQGVSAPNQTTSKNSWWENLAGGVSAITGLGGLTGWWAEGGEVEQPAPAGWQGPQANVDWQMVDGRYQLTPQEASVGGGEIGRGYIPKQIGYDDAGATQLTQGGGSGGGGGVSSAGSNYVQGTNLTQEELDAYEAIIDPSGNYDATSDVLTPEQRAYVEGNEEARLAQEDIAHSILGGENAPRDWVGDLIEGYYDNSIIGTGAKWLGAPDDLISDGSGSGSLVTGSASDDDDLVHPDSVKQDDGTYDISGWFNDTPGESSSATSSSSTTSSDTGGGWAESSWNPSNWWAEGGRVPYQQGGFVEGKQTAQLDDVPAWLEEGEFVINEHAWNAMPEDLKMQIKMHNEKGKAGVRQQKAMGFARGGGVADNYAEKICKEMGI